MRRVQFTPLHMRQRLQWARDHIHWVNEWRSLLLSDEFRYVRFSDSRRVRVWSLSRTSRNRCSFQRVYQYRGGSIKVSSDTCFNGCIDLYMCEGNMNAEQYKQLIINNHFTKFSGYYRPRHLDENARPHRALALLNAIEN